MKSITTMLCTFALVGGGWFVASAQDKGTAARQSKEVQQSTTETTNAKTTKTSTDTVYGKIESYDVNKSIKVTVPGKIVQTKSFTLDGKDTTVNAAPDLKVGEWVSVSEKTDNNGHKTITIHPSTQKQASRMKRTR